jgi:tetratricopeptide (TPR) repeat protein
MGAVSTASRDPRRLVDGESRAGRLLQQAEVAFLADLSTNRAWNRFKAERQKKAVIRFGALAVALGLCVSFVRHHSLGKAPSAPVLVAERVPTLQVKPTVPPTSSALERRIPPPSSLIPKAHLPARRAPAFVPQRAEPATDATCRGLANGGQAQRAIECFESVAQGSGVPAQVALYEAARLSADALHDSQRALQFLDQHQARFPEGVLRIEVEWLRVRCLEHAGRLDEALATSEALLNSAAGRSLAAKLHLLRGRIYGSARKDCGRALPEFVALLGEPGSAGADAELLRAECLEQLQRTGEARAAYQHYIDRADARDRERARARLQALSMPAAPAEGQP